MEVAGLGHWIPAFAGMTGVRLSTSMLNSVTPVRIYRIKGLAGLMVRGMLVRDVYRTNVWVRCDYDRGALSGLARGWCKEFCLNQDLQD